MGIGTAGPRSAGVAPPPAESMPEPALRDLLADLRSEVAQAARLAAVLASLAGQRIGLDTVRARGMGGSEFATVPRLLEAFARRGLLTVEGAFIQVSVSFPSDLPTLLRGAAAMLAVYKPETEVEIALTDVGPGTRFARALQAVGLQATRLIATRAVFEDVALSAERRLVIAIPFIDEDGAQMLLHMFERTPARERVLIVRHTWSVRKAFGTDAPRLTALGVRVVVYRITDATGFETFHAKVVLADEDFAYVGSANALVNGRVPLELGVRLRGRAVRDVAIAVNAMIEAVGT